MDILRYYKLELVKIYELGSETRYRYKFNKEPLTLCKNIFSLSNYNIDKVNVTTTYNSSRPCITSNIISIKELDEYVNTGKVVVITFKGFYHNNYVQFTINFDLLALFVIGKQQVVEDLITILNEKGF